MNTRFENKYDMLSSILNGINLLIILLDENFKIIYASKHVNEHYKIF